MALSDALQNAVARVAPEPRATPSRIERRSMIVRRSLKARGEVGHWEGELIICKCARPVLVLHERKSRVTPAARLTGENRRRNPSQRCWRWCSSHQTSTAKIDALFDNDIAFAQHGLLMTMRDMTTWFW